MSLAVALAAGILAAASITYMTRARAAVLAALEKAASAEREAAAETGRLSSRVRHLQREVETLSAIREVALIANDDVSFERILGDVLKVVEDLVGARSLAIALADDLGGAPALRARRARGATTFHEPPPPPGSAAAVTTASGKVRALPLGDAEALEAEHDRALVEEAFRAKRPLARLEGGDLAVTALLYADGEVGGVLLARVPSAGRAEDELAAIPPALLALAKHVALAIKKPTLYDKAVVDSLTRLFTKRHFTSQLQKACAIARRASRPFALVLCDVDHFKKVNDVHGHLSGDLVLSDVAATIARTVRETDQAFRYGGEEMAVLAPEADLEAARALAERLRAAVEARTIASQKGDPLRVTASFGVAAYGPGALEPAAIIAAADAALYAAKGAGRNRVRAAGDPADADAAPSRKKRRAAAPAA